MLSDIIHVKSKVSATPSSPQHGPSDYVFEIHCSAETVYYVGVNPGARAADSAYSARGVVCSMRSGSGLDQALSWEMAIRQARLPLATIPSISEPSSSAETTASQQATSESLFYSRMFIILTYVLTSFYFVYIYIWCFDTVGWASGRASCL